MTNRQPTTRAGWWRLFLAAIAAALVTLLGAGTASATTPTVAETRVGASTPAVAHVVGVAEHIAAGQRWGNAPPRAETTVATGVAAKAGAGAGDDLTRLYRAVDPAELKDIVGSGVYRSAPGGTEGKYFFPTKAQAENFSNLMGKTGTGPYCITSGCIPRSTLNGIETIHPAGEGTAYFIPQNLLPQFRDIIIHGPQ